MLCPLLLRIYEYFNGVCLCCACVSVCVCSRYISADEKRKSGVKAQGEMLIHRKRKHPSNPTQTVSVPYKVVSNPLRLSQEDW